MKVSTFTVDFGSSRISFLLPFIQVLNFLVSHSPRDSQKPMFTWSGIKYGRSTERCTLC